MSGVKASGGGDKCGAAGWSGSTLFAAAGNKAKDECYIDNQRHGALLYRRQK